MTNKNKTALQTFRHAIERTVTHCANEGIVNPDELIKILGDHIRVDQDTLIKALGDRKDEIQKALRADVWARIVKGEGLA